jgi:hypothetical protein
MSNAPAESERNLEDELAELQNRMKLMSDEIVNYLRPENYEYATAKSSKELLNRISNALDEMAGF